MFKYLVTQEDPQKWFTISVLIVNFICFIIISISYITINAKMAKSSKKLAGPGNRDFERRNRKLQLKVSAIVLTDFLCWIPFTIVCFLHFIEVLDATLWYPVFSNIILPINSVINPLLYDPLLGARVLLPFKASYRRVSVATSTIRRRITSIQEPVIERSTNVEQIEMTTGPANKMFTLELIS